MEQVYLHGYSQKERNRLRYQAKLLESFVYEKIDFKGAKNLLEVGVGVGAQSEILLRRFPGLKITGVDISEVQLATAQQNLRLPLKKGKVELFKRDASKMTGLKREFDSAFICWFLEHVPDPLAVLKETRSKLKPGSPIYCSEVQNSGLFVDPYSPGILKYWFEYNDLQWLAKGHPFVGAQLGNLLKEAGYKKIEVWAQTMIFDSRNPKMRATFIEYFEGLLLSGLPLLKDKKRVTPALIAQIKKELKMLARSKNSVVFFPFCQARAEA